MSWSPDRSNGKKIPTNLRLGPPQNLQAGPKPLAQLENLCAYPSVTFHASGDPEE